MDTKAKRKCKICSATLKGRTDKIFCSLNCKNYYHVNLRRVTTIAVKDINKMLHRNRSILLEVLGKRREKLMTLRTVLDKKKFNFNYQTGSYINSKGKTYHYVYDFAWMEFGNGEVLITKVNKKRENLSRKVQTKKTIK